MNSSQSRSLVSLLRSPHTCAALATLAALATPSITYGQSGFVDHVDQQHLLQLVAGGLPTDAYTEAFDGGDQAFHFFFVESDGVGANVGQGKRFTRIPRADLNGPNEWFNLLPPRPTGPNEQACTACHTLPMDDGAGGIAHNVTRDPLRLGDPSKYIERQTTHLFGSGAVQRVAEEMTTALQALRDAAGSEACASGLPVTKPLVAKGISFGSIVATPSTNGPCTITFDTTGVVGVSADLIVRPFGWKGDTVSMRKFCRNASNNEIGMQGVELIGPGSDGDFDGVSDEFTVGDITGMVIYVTGQPRPLTNTELDSYGLLETPLTNLQKRSIRNGRQLFQTVGCTTCHRPSLTLDVPIFSEPSQNPDYRDPTFPAGQDPLVEGVDPAFAVSYDLTKDLPDNIIVDPKTGREIARLGNFKSDAQGHAIVELFGDLKRHDMGPGLAESIDEVGTGNSNFLTENLWGCGSTAPYLHDGRATTLEQAILLHGGEAQASRDAFALLSAQSRADVEAFLANMVLAKLE
ncbi:MAG: hypothetical protein K8S98_07520 [Planctomycetes bacterium]|nr:hypothetical protein [Planctomycetota bacterium]